MIQRSRLCNPFLEFRSDEINQSIPCRFESQVANQPQRLAVKAKDRSYTYEELNHHANGLAWSLLNQRGETSEPVGLLLAQSPALIAAVLAVLKSGKAFVPLEPSHPADRIRQALSDVEVAALITDETHADLAYSLVGDRCPVLDVSEMLTTGPVGNPDLSITPESLAYVYHTSGSTGRAKAVADTHRNVLHNVMRYTNTLQIGKHDRLSLLQSVSFSGAVSNIFCALLNGAALCPYDVRADGLGPALANWLNYERITMLHSVPAIFRTLELSNVGFPTVRVVRLEGDAASEHDVEIYRERFGPACVLVNGLGTTETGICRQFFIDKETSIEGGRVPVGYPVMDMEVLLLDDDGNEIKGEAIGEIAVRSKYLAAKYWGDTELTQRVFRADPAGSDLRVYRTGDLGRMRDDQCLEHLGRKNSRPRIWGQWLDLTEVEATIRKIAAPKEIVVCADSSAGATEARLIAYLIAGDKPIPPEPELRRMLARSLPSYMVPKAFVMLETMPLDPNGKINRRALAPPEPGRPDYLPTPVLPRNELERELTSIWEEVLGIAPIGVYDNFFDLRGDSLTDLTIRSALDAKGIVRLPDSSWVEISTISQLAAHIVAGADPVPAIVALRESGLNRPLFCVPDRNGGIATFATLAQKLGHEQPVYVVPLLSADLDEPHSTIEQLAAKQVAAMRRIQPAGPYNIAGFCVGAVVALEIAQQLLACGERVATLSFINITAYDFPSLVSSQAWRRYHVNVKGKLRFLYRRSNRWSFLAAQIGKRANYLRRNIQRKVEQRFGRRWPRPSPARDRFDLQSAFKFYVPRRYPGHVTLFLSALATSIYTDDPEKDWQQLANRGVSVHMFPCDGRSMLNHPDIVHDLATRLSERLCAAGSEDDGPAGCV